MVADITGDDRPDQPAHQNPIKMSYAKPATRRIDLVNQFLCKISETNCPQRSADHGGSYGADCNTLNLGV
jgi:hypothetical protein